jgi:hypothetical protein
MLVRMFDAAGVVEMGRQIAATDPAAASDDELCEWVVALAELQSLVAAGVAHAAAELEARGVCDREFGLSTAAWLAREASVPSHVAREAVKTGTKLRTPLGQVDQALVDGRISAHHAKVLAEACNPRVADAVAEIQTELIALADHCGFEQWRAEVRAIVETLDQDGAHDPNEDLARNHLSVADTIDGITHLAGHGTCQPF